MSTVITQRTPFDKNTENLLFKFFDDLAGFSVEPSSVMYYDSLLTHPLTDTFFVPLSEIDPDAFKELVNILTGGLGPDSMTHRQMSYRLTHNCKLLFQDTGLKTTPERRLLSFIGKSIVENKYKPNTTDPGSVTSSESRHTLLDSSRPTMTPCARVGNVTSPLTPSTKKKAITSGQGGGDEGHVLPYAVAEFTFGRGNVKRYQSFPSNRHSMSVSSTNQKGSEEQVGEKRNLSLEEDPQKHFRTGVLQEALAIFERVTSRLVDMFQIPDKVFTVSDRTSIHLSLTDVNDKILIPYFYRTHHEDIRTGKFIIGLVGEFKYQLQEGLKRFIIETFTNATNTLMRLNDEEVALTTAEQVSIITTAWTIRSRLLAGEA